MARRLKQEVGPEAAAEIQAAERNGKGGYLPFEGKENLQPPEKVNGKLKYFPRYMMKRELGTGGIEVYKLIRVMRKPSGVSRMLVAQLKPTVKGRTKDKAIFDQLKKARIPGA